MSTWKLFTPFRKSGQIWVDICRKLPHLFKRTSEQKEEESLLTKSRKKSKENQYESVRLNYTRLFWTTLCIYILFYSFRSTAPTTRLAMCIWDLNVGNVWVLSGWKFFSHFLKLDKTVSCWNHISENRVREKEKIFVRLWNNFLHLRLIFSSKFYHYLESSHQRTKAFDHQEQLKAQIFALNADIFNFLNFSINRFTTQV
jgi:hypothetical protein